MPKGQNTKELILDTALNLFSERGYDGVGMREIAGAIGIRESALYKHYASKQDILEKLVASLKAEYVRTQAQFQISGDIGKMVEKYKAITLDELIKISQTLFLYYIDNERVIKFRRLLTMEQFRNEKIGELYREIYYTSLLDYEAAIFKGLVESGTFINADPEIIALHFYAPIFMLFTHYDEKKVSKEAALEKLTKHVTQFSKLYDWGMRK